MVAVSNKIFDLAAFSILPRLVESGSQSRQRSISHFEMFDNLNIFQPWMLPCSALQTAKSNEIRSSHKRQVVRFIVGYCFVLTFSRNALRTPFVNRTSNIWILQRKHTEHGAADVLCIMAKCSAKSDL